MDTNSPPPIVTVICTCFNHAPYVCEALNSVLTQSYQHIQLIVVDNASSDNSAEVIYLFLNQHPEVHFICNTENLGICRAFNLACQSAVGKYLVDLSADDILLPDRIERQVKAFEHLGDEHGLLYSNVEEVDKNGKHIRYSIMEGVLSPSGDVFAALLESHFLPSPSTMFRKNVFDCLGCYNESLAFEDFDFWVRCAYQYKFHYLPMVSTKKRILDSSLSTHFYSTSSTKMLASTLETYCWAERKLRNETDKKAFTKGLSYYFRQCVWLGHFQLGSQYLACLQKHGVLSPLDKIASVFLRFKINVSGFYLFYMKHLVND